MDSHVREFYTPYSQEPTDGHFHAVIPLHESPSLSWEDVKKLVPQLCKGWYELARLPPEDRIEFTRDYWLAKLPYNSHLLPGIERFFSSLDDIGIFVIQPKYEDPYTVHFVYSLKDDGGFFHGELPATEEDIEFLEAAFSSTLLPIDYLAFMRIHNGFSKVTDTGLTPAHRMVEKYQHFQRFLEQTEMVVTTRGDPIDATMLIPFYESFGRPFFQCFYGGWYPAQEMGNIYFSGVTQTVSDFTSGEPMDDSMAFPTFIDWLVFYLDRVE